MAKKLVVPTGKANVGDVISSGKKDEPNFDKFYVVDKFKYT